MSGFWAFVRGHWFSAGLFVGIAWFLVLRIYYSVKPYMPARLRLVLRRLLARRKRAQSADRWPILERAGEPPKNWCEWPEGKEFAFVLTHDVEGPRGLSRVRALAEVEMSLGFRSCFNFVPEGGYRVAQDLREWLVASGFEVGVHDLRHDGSLYKSHRHFAQAVPRINHYVKEWNASGFRSGFMFHNLEWIGALDIIYDSSTFDTDPFEPQSDGTGTIFPFLVRLDQGREYVELPYTLVQDSTLFIMLQEDSSAIWKQKFEWIRSRRGMALLNVHPDYVCFGSTEREPDEYPVSRYTEFLAWAKEHHSTAYWHTLPANIARFVKKGFGAALVFALSSFLPEAAFSLSLV